TGMGQHDVVARVGGDEFVVLLPDSTANHAEAAITRVRASSTVPFSIGVAERRDGEDAQEVISRADQAMYEQKRVRRAGPSESDASLDPIPSR
ncbi:MAG TPA: GGDEF domain-containing protein, partial [Microthrixaceae bacterium]|nr:GGDEF domain-containing protein [Microthrixaceae bacterium]